MTAPDYTDPGLTILILDFLKEDLVRDCIYSVNRHVKVPHHIHYLHNGHCEYAHELYNEGLVDLLIQPVKNEGLGLGTRQLVASCFSPWFMMLQVDQTICRDFTEEEFTAIRKLISINPDGDYPSVASVSLAGPVGGRGVYSERCHITETAIYKEAEHLAPLPVGGAGPYSHQPWREGAMQAYYRKHRLIHHTEWEPLVRDRGVWTIRDNPDGSRLRMRTDTKGVWWMIKPKESYVFPEMTPSEWDTSIAGQWVGGTVPEPYRPHSFNCWGDVKP